MNDNDFYNACAIAAMQALIAKVPLADTDRGDDADAIGYQVCKSADRYAADMVRIRRDRLAPPDPAGTQPSINTIEPPVTLSAYSGRDLEVAAKAAEAKAEADSIPAAAYFVTKSTIGTWPDGSAFQCFTRRLTCSGDAPLVEALIETLTRVRPRAGNPTDGSEFLVALYNARRMEQRSTGERWWQVRYATQHITERGRHPIAQDNEYKQRPLTAEESSRLEEERKRLY